MTLLEREMGIALLASSSKISHLASESVETQLIPDPYSYIVGPNGKLLCKDKKGLGLVLVEGSVEKNSYLGKIEFKAFVSLQTWAEKSNDGLNIWISPPFAGYYPSAKITISEILKEKNLKIIFNWAINVDSKKNDCVTIANKLMSLQSLQKKSGVFFCTTEEVRANSVPVNPPNNIDWTYFLSKFIYAPDAWQDIRSGRALEKKQKALAEAKRLLASISYNEAYSAMQRTGMIGNNSSSCPRLFAFPTTAFELLFQNAFFVETFFSCPNCHKKISTGRGITVCPHCGARKENYPSCT